MQFTMSLQCRTGKLKLPGMVDSKNRNRRCEEENHSTQKSAARGRRSGHLSLECAPYLDRVAGRAVLCAPSHKTLEAVPNGTVHGQALIPHSEGLEPPCVAATIAREVG
jgi:hypothetical protein